MDLEKAAHYLGFEVYHLRYYVGLYKQDKDFKAIGRFLGPAMQDSLSYSLLVHLRVLLTFFYPGQRKPGDCSVRHFIPQFRYARSTYKKQEIEKIRRHLSKRLVHFNSVRWTEADKHIGLSNYSHCADHIDELLTVFEAGLEELDPSIRKSYTARLQRFQRSEKSIEDVLALIKRAEECLKREDATKG
ncbi:MAG: hypothetical protein ABI811_17070 [Acidobacteriota bacterium]